MSACAHDWQPAGVPDYAECAYCGSLRSLTAPEPEAVYTPDYWAGTPIRSSMADQVYNIVTHREGGITKADYVLRLLDPPDRSMALEIGCAPGALLKRLHDEAGFNITAGIEMRAEYEAGLREQCGPEPILLFGRFPQVTAGLWPGMYSAILAIDVFEHSPEPEAFLAECCRLLKPGGQLILMLPILGMVGGGGLPERFYAPEEHVFLPSFDWLCDVLPPSGFRQATFGRWCAGHETATTWRAA